MKALAYTRYGGPEVMELIDAPRPVPTAGEVLVKVVAAGLNPVDAVQRQGGFRRLRRYRFPTVAGNEFSGTVAALGEGVTGLDVGQAVVARVDKTSLGAFAEWATVDRHLVARAPSRVPLADAAGLPLAGLTAWQALGEEYLAVGPGDRLLITGGAGGVGLLAIQLATLAGAQVTTTASPAGEDLVRSMGADAVIDYRRRSVSAGPEEFDKVLDLVGGETLTDLVTSVRPGGRIVSVAGPLTPGCVEGDLGLPTRWVVTAALTVGSRAIRRAARRAGVSYTFMFMRPDGAGLAHLASLVDDGDLRLTTDARFPLERYAQAFERLESRRAKGKVILEIG